MRHIIITIITLPHAVNCQSGSRERYNSSMHHIVLPHQDHIAPDLPFHGS